MRFGDSGRFWGKSGEVRGQHPDLSWLALDQVVAGRPQAPGEFGDMVGAHLAAAADDGRALVDPAHCEIGIGGRVQVGAGFQRVGKWGLSYDLAGRWRGARPCTTDMKPIIGRAPEREGLWFAFGHGHQGFTLGPVTGLLLAQVMEGETPIVDLTPFSPARFR